METQTEEVQEQPSEELDVSHGVDDAASSQETETVTEQTPPPPAGGLDANTLKTLIAEVFQKGQATATPKVEALDPFDVSKLTPDELQRKFNMWNPSKEFVQRLRSEDEDVSLAAIGELVNGLVRQSVTMATFQQQAALQPYEQRLGTLQSFYAQQREVDATQRFAKAHPDLVAWEPLVQAVREQFVREIQAGTRPAFSSDTAAFTALAEQTRKLVKQLPGGSGGRQQQTQTTRPSTVIAGGQGGAGVGSSARPTGKVEKLWA